MSDVTDNPQPTGNTGDEPETGDQTILEKAKEAAPDIDDVKEIAGKAKDAVSNIDVKEIADKAKDVAAGVKDRVTDFVGDHEDQISGAIDKTGRFVDEKLTRSKFSEKIDRAEEAAKNVVHKVGSADEGDGSATPEPPADAPTDPGDTQA